MKPRKKKTGPLRSTTGPSMAPINEPPTSDGAIGDFSHGKEIPDKSNLPEVSLASPLSTKDHEKSSTPRRLTMIPIGRVSRSFFKWLIANRTGILVGILGGIIGTLPFRWLDERNDKKIQDALLTVIGDIERQIRTSDLQGGLLRIKQLETQLPESLDTVLYGRMQEVKAEGLLRLLDIGDQEERQIDATLVALRGAERAASEDSKVVLPGRVLRLRCEAFRRRSEIRMAMHYATEALQTCDLAIVSLADDPGSYEILRAQIERALVLRILGELSDQGKHLDQAAIELRSMLSRADASGSSELPFLARNALGTVYMRRAQRGKAGDAERAISILKEVLLLAPRESQPIAWARAQANLCSSYRSDALRASKQRLLAAIEACEGAIQVFDDKNYPRLYAGVRLSLSGVYSLLAGIDDPHENLQKSISEAEAALTAVSLDKYPIEYARANHNLGFAHASLSERDENDTEHAKLAIKALREAMKGRIREFYPYEFSLSRAIQAWAYILLARSEDSVDNIHQAIEIATDEVAVARRADREIDVARLGEILGIGYKELIRHEESSENLRQALQTLDAVRHYYESNGNSYYAGYIEVLKAEALMNFAEVTGELAVLVRAQSSHELASRYIDGKEAPAQYEILGRSRRRLSDLRTKLKLKPQD